MKGQFAGFAKVTTQYARVLLALQFHKTGRMCVPHHFKIKCNQCILLLYIMSGYIDGGWFCY